jgi:predicted amidophosphoribosyltransferase
MLPAILLAGTVAALYAAKPRCSVCQSRFTLNQECMVCGKNVCGDCGFDVEAVDEDGWPVSAKGRVCIAHKQQHMDETAIMVEAVKRSAGVETFSKNYSGPVPAPKLGKILQTPQYRERDHAARHLKIMAALEDCATLTNIEYQRDTGHQGNYSFTVWKASGLV